MKSYLLVLTGLASLSCGLLLTGCTSTDYGNTSPYHPGPVVGKTVGNAAGVVAGNVAGLGVGVVEGAAHGIAAPFNPELSHGALLAHGNHIRWPDNSSALRYFGGSIWPPGEHAGADGKSQAAAGNGTAAGSTGTPVPAPAALQPPTAHPNNLIFQPRKNYANIHLLSAGRRFPDRRIIVCR